MQLVIALSLLLVMSGSTQASNVCGPVQQATGACGYSGGQLVVGAQVSEAPAGSTQVTSQVGGTAAERQEAVRRWRAYLASLAELCVDMNEDQSACVPPPADPADPAPLAASDPVTIEDLAQFRPIVGELVVEPDGWGVVGTPTNFYATAETHTMDGTLFDAPIQVRWTPSEFHFDYGDGTTQTTTAPGSAWGDDTWTDTATSHTYTSRDDATATLTVVFTAEVDAGSGWIAIPGTLPIAAPGHTVKLFDVDTVLTDGDCLTNPTAPGCED